MGKRPEGWVGSDLRARAEVVQWLTLHGGEIHDPQGLIIGRMRTDLRKGRALSQLIADMERDGMIEREVRGRRTMMLKLVDDWGLLDEAREHQEWQIQGVTTDGDGDGDGRQDLTGVDLEGLAATLLARVIKLAHARPSNGAETERLREQLAEMKAQRDEARDAVILAREAEAEHRRQADKMRESLAKLTATQTTPAAGSVKLRDALTDKDRKLLDRLMREVPSRRG
jgi:hypothetical protein